MKVTADHEFFSAESRSPIQRPGLPYLHVYDSCAVEMARCAGKVAVIASDAQHAGELLCRFNSGRASGQEFWLFAVGEWHNPRAHSLPAWVNLGTLGQPEGDGQFSLVVWAEPSADNAATITRAAHALLTTGGKLCVMISGSLAHQLAERRRGAITAQPLGWHGTSSLLRSAGFSPMESVGYQGVVSNTLTFLSGVFDRVGRAAWADRLHHLMRRTISERGWRRRSAVLGLMIASRQA
jgi:hypothetical protein